MKIDYTASDAAGFKDARSYIKRDGRQILYGEDMRRRREQVFERDGGKCRRCHVTVSLERMEMHHVIHKGSNGVDRDDRISNCLCLCSQCHKREHVRPIWQRRGEPGHGR